VNPTPPKAIVLVDDERSYTELMTQLLSDNLDCPVHAFTRPADALREIPHLDPGVIVTDYFMPQIDGLEFIRRASVLAPDAHFVLITGHNLSAEQETMDRLTALKGFLAKPFGWRKLADEIIRVWPDPDTAPVHKADATSL
jgi:DNA-binding NtrC family response regulator